MTDVPLCVPCQSLELVIRGDGLRLTNTPKKEKRPLFQEGRSEVSDP